MKMIAFCCLETWLSVLLVSFAAGQTFLPVAEKLDERETVLVVHVENALAALQSLFQSDLLTALSEMPVAPLIEAIGAVEREVGDPFDGDPIELASLLVNTSSNILAGSVTLVVVTPKRPGEPFRWALSAGIDAGSPLFVWIDAQSRPFRMFGVRWRPQPVDGEVRKYILDNGLSAQLEVGRLIVGNAIDAVDYSTEQRPKFPLSESRRFRSCLANVIPNKNAPGSIQVYLDISRFLQSCEDMDHSWADWAKVIWQAGAADSLALAGEICLGVSRDDDVAARTEAAKSSGLTAKFYLHQAVPRTGFNQLVELAELNSEDVGQVIGNSDFYFVTRYSPYRLHNSIEKLLESDGKAFQQTWAPPGREPLGGREVLNGWLHGWLPQIYYLFREFDHQKLELPNVHWLYEQFGVIRDQINCFEVKRGEITTLDSTDAAKVRDVWLRMLREKDAGGSAIRKVERKIGDWIWFFRAPDLQNDYMPEDSRLYAEQLGIEFIPYRPAYGLGPGRIVKLDDENWALGLEVDPDSRLSDKPEFQDCIRCCWNQGQPVMFHWFSFRCIFRLVEQRIDHQLRRLLGGAEIRWSEKMSNGGDSIQAAVPESIRNLERICRDRKAWIAMDGRVRIPNCAMAAYLTDNGLVLRLFVK